MVCNTGSTIQSNLCYRPPVLNKSDLFNINFLRLVLIERFVCNSIHTKYRGERIRRGCIYQPKYATLIWADFISPSNTVAWYVFKSLVRGWHAPVGLLKCPGYKGEEGFSYWCDTMQYYMIRHDTTHTPTHTRIKQGKTSCISKLCGFPSQAPGCDDHHPRVMMVTSRGLDGRRTNFWTWCLD